MNSAEEKMVDILKDLKENYGAEGIKAEFEAEGTRMEEAMRLKDIISKAGLGLTIKIGGCEAKKDIYEAINIGVERIVAPMVETPYALIKYLRIIKELHFRAAIACFINIETITSCLNFSKMVTQRGIGFLKGIVIGRIDLTGSLGLSRDDVCDKRIFKLTKDIVVAAKAHNLEVCIGGGVGASSMPFFKALPAGSLDRVETRKVIFNYKHAVGNMEKGMKKALEFELLWLEYKCNFYYLIGKEDESRICLLRKRIKEL
jgi:hypothetical protein